MKNRIVLLCLLLSVVHSLQAQRKPKKVVFLIGDGMGLAQISAAMAGYQGRDAFARFPVIGLSKTSSADDYVTDSGAGATVFSIGKKTFNGGIGVGADSLAYENLFEKLKKRRKGTGVVVTSSVTHATPAAFYAHVPSRRSEDEIASFLLKGNCDIAIGGGIRYFASRSDGRDLFGDLRKQGFTTIADSVNPYRTQTAGRIVYALAGDGMKTIREGRGDYLQKATLNAMDILGRNPNGYLLMIEGSQIDWGGHAMDFDYMKSELLDFNETINQVLDMAKKQGDVLVVVTADHETGGLTLNENPGDRSTFKPHYTYNKHTGIMVPVFAFGPGSERFAGTYENTAIFDKLCTLLELK